MKIHILAATVISLTTMFEPSLAEVPPQIADEIRKIGPKSDVPNTIKLYVPLFQNQKEPYPNVTVPRDIAYGPDPLNRIDLFTSGATGPANRTVVVYFHGGGLEGGNKTRPGTFFTDNLMLWLTQQGMIGITSNYRLAPKNPWPSAHEDVAAVIGWVQANAAQYGVDPNRVVLWGVSSGADLIAGYLTHPQFHGATGHGVKAAVLISGIYDFAAVFDDPRIASSAYFGTNPKELKERSSVEGMQRLTIPLFISRAELDISDVSTQVEAIKKSLCDAGHCPTYAVFKDHSHISQMYSVGTADTSVSGPIRRKGRPRSLTRTRPRRGRRCVWGPAPRGLRRDCVRC
jgi:triacylglycerol lipase